MTSEHYAELRRRVIRHEGLRLRAYTDTAGCLTIGFGRNLTDHGISQDEALDLLDNDLAQATTDLAQIAPWVSALDWPRHSVLIEMCFNMGAHRLATFEKMLAAVRSGNYLKASAEMLDSRWAKQVGSRASTLATIMQTGAMQEEKRA